MTSRTRPGIRFANAKSTAPVAIATIPSGIAAISCTTSGWGKAMTMKPLIPAAAKM